MPKDFHYQLFSICPWLSVFCTKSVISEICSLKFPTEAPVLGGHSGPLLRYPHPNTRGDVCFSNVFIYTNIKVYLQR